MARGRVSFKERDLARAMRAARRSGVPLERVEIDREGRIILVPGKPGEAVEVEAAKPNSQNSLDDELAEWEARRSGQD